jgi:hypothetical protein
LYRKEEAKSGDKQVALKLLPTNKKTKQICSESNFFLNKIVEDVGLESWEYVEDVVF